MDYQPKTPTAPGLIISDEVVAAIAINSAKDVPGVIRLVPRQPDIKSLFMGYDDAQRFVKVTASDSDLKLQLSIIIKNGEKIPDVSAEVQHAVKNSVQAMTGMVVSKINIIVAGLESAEPTEEDN